MEREDGKKEKKKNVCCDCSHFLNNKQSRPLIFCGRALFWHNIHSFRAALSDPTFRGVYYHNKDWTIYKDKIINSHQYNTYIMILFCFIRSDLNLFECHILSGYLKTDVFEEHLNAPYAWTGKRIIQNRNYISTCKTRSLFPWASRASSPSAPFW